MFNRNSFGRVFIFVLITLLLIVALSAAGCSSVRQGKDGIQLEKSGTEAANPQSIPLKKFKILHVMSYHSPWEWADSQLNGFKDALRDMDVEYKVYQMDTKRNDSEEWKQKAGKEAQGLIETWKPDLVYTSDDDAQKYVTKYYINKDIPFVFSAVNEQPDIYGFTGSKNITGVLEREHITESVKLLKQIVPGVKTVAIITDEAAMWEPVIQRIKAQSGKVLGVEFPICEKIATFNEYKQKVAELQTKVDAIALLGVFNFKGEDGKNVPYQDVGKWTVENSRLPEFSFWSDRISSGTLCGVVVSGYEQGLAAGKIARGILIEGKSPSSFPIKSTERGEAIINLARANSLGIKIRSTVLLSASIKNQFEWGK